MCGVPDVLLGDLLGAGGMGRVFAAEDSKHAPVAVKVLHEVLASDPIMVDRFLDEGRAARRVTHRNVVRVFDHGMSAAGTPYLVMERAPGVPLGSLIQREGPLPFSRIRAIAAQIFAGLAAIHRAGLVHGDLKSDNILVDETDRVTIIDFGLARPPGTRPAFGDDQMLTGTPEYMAPELIRGEPISTASELYAVGVILYEMLTGGTPFGGGTTTAVFERHLNDELVPPTLRCPDRTIPVSLEAVILRALDKDPAARHLNADLFATAVDRSVSADCDRVPHRIDRSDQSDRHADTDAPTRSWTVPRVRAPQKAAKAVHPRRRFAEGTVPRDSAAVQHLRNELCEAVARREPDPIVVAYLALVQALVDEHRLVAAARELEAGIAWLADQRLVPPSLWRLQLTLAAIYDGLGDHKRAHGAALDASAEAERAADAHGRARAQALLRRHSQRSAPRAPARARAERRAR